MAEIIEVKGWRSHTAPFRIDMKSLTDLHRIADALKIPFIIKKDKEYVVFSGHIGPAPVAYYFRE